LFGRGLNLFYYKEKLVFASKQYHKVVIFGGEITFLAPDIFISCNKMASYYNLFFPESKETERRFYQKATSNEL
jgi:5-bromo-4-chloroindolyl phosphate hydrolysis protein